MHGLQYKFDIKMSIKYVMIVITMMNKYNDCLILGWAISAISMCHLCMDSSAVSCNAASLPSVMVIALGLFHDAKHTHSHFT